MIKRLKATNKNIRNSILENFPNIKVIGVGGAGGNILSRMKQAKIEGVEFIVVNTDLQDLYKSGIKRKIHIGKNISRGMGSGMNPEVGRQAAEESREQLEEAIKEQIWFFWLVVWVAVLVREQRRDSRYLSTIRCFNNRYCN
jgi:cell division GTPase FtsZ